jgi:hypothetical protein
MIQGKGRLRRLDRANQTSAPKEPSLWEMVRSLPPSPLAAAELARRAAEAKQAAAPPEPPVPAEAARPTSAEPRAETKRTPVEARPPAPPPEPQWWEEKCRWRPREAADWDDDGERYETVHEYDPVEWALDEPDYDWDS